MGFKVWIYSSSEEGFRSIGLRHSETIDLFNGGQEFSMRLFELYEGVKKDFTPTDRGRSSFLEKSDQREGRFTPNRRDAGDSKSRRISDGDRRSRFSTDKNDGGVTRENRFSKDRPRTGGDDRSGAYKRPDRGASFDRKDKKFTRDSGSKPGGFDRKPGKFSSDRSTAKPNESRLSKERSDQSGTKDSKETHFKNHTDRPVKEGEEGKTRKFRKRI